MSTTALTRRTHFLPALLDDFVNPWNQLFGDNLSWGKALTVPPVNILENNDEYRIAVAVPGRKKEDFSIDVEGNILTISSELEETKEEKEKKYTRKEYSYTSFSRSFTLPEDVAQDKIEASYTDGTLKVILPRKEEARKVSLSKNISVK